MLIVLSIVVRSCSTLAGTINDVHRRQSKAVKTWLTIMVPASVASSVRVHSLVHYVHRVTSRCKSSCCERVYLIRAEFVCHSRFKRAGITHSWHTVRVIAEGGCHCELLVGNEPAIKTQNITRTICIFGLLTTLVKGITFQFYYRQSEIWSKTSRKSSNHLLLSVTNRPTTKPRHKLKPMI